jgi:predicted RNA polymerase sigma factor
MTAVLKRPPARTLKQPQDTVAGCRDRAEADLLASVVLSTANERRRLETSAASWSARADMLQRLDDTHAARKAQVAASFIGEDEDSPIRL